MMRNFDEDFSIQPSFSVGRYLRDRWLALIIGCVCVLGVYGMCATLGVGFQACIAVSVFILLCICLLLVCEYVRRARYWRSVCKMNEDIRHTCEVTSLIKEPSFLEGRLSYAALERLSDLSNTELTLAQRSSTEYREYIELWIHEAKTPIAAAKLILDRMGGADADALSRELERVGNQIDQALYYARSTALNKDYSIRQVSLAHAAREACKRQARFLIEKQTIPSIDISDDVQVLSDEPWLVFMLGQILANAAQYGASSVSFTATEEAANTPHGRTVLEVRDNGCGISAADMPRVFDRGFTGSNGRESGSATGMGLYLVSLMCARLSLGVSLASEEGVGTRVMLSFPHDRRRLHEQGIKFS
ncbi:sensor histidine kinase [Adlercreutzia sp. ZJ304]|uniref:sensor histidine kinase n=1 Tax=Adlercreutzia sp. ZJ304 TaxID=2709791 RepID=UPI001F14B1F4|nr:sensor histidine kinase [Adlercreutzia sp. ZJ304]